MPCRVESGAQRCDRLSELDRHFTMRDEPLGRVSSVPHSPVSSGMAAGSSSFDAVAAHTQPGTPCVFK